MQTQINQIVPGQSANPFLAKRDQSSGKTGPETPGEKETFETVMDRSLAPKKDAPDTEAAIQNKGENEPSPEEASADAPDATGDVESVTALEDDMPDGQFGVADNGDEPDVNAARIGEAEPETDTKMLSVDDHLPPATNSSDKHPKDDMPAQKTSGNGTVPAWFSLSDQFGAFRSQGGDAGTPTSARANETQQIQSLTVPAGAASGQVLENGAQVPGDAKRVARASFAENSGQSVSLPVAKALGSQAHNTVPVATNQSPAPVALSEKLASIDAKASRQDKVPVEKAPVAVTPTTVSGAQGTSATAMQPPTLASSIAGKPAMSGPNALDEVGNIKWLSDADVSTHSMAQDLPPTSRAMQTALLQQPDLPRHVAAQLAYAMRQGGAERPMELVLSPAELGRVRISMQAGDGAMVVQIIAERPETLDLMRRNIDQLAQEFRNMGFESAEFAFGQNTSQNEAFGDADGEQSQNLASTRVEEAETADTTAQPSRQIIQSDRVDLRL